MNIEQVADNIYTFPIVLPNNPLKWLNCYVVSSGGRNLLIDTGFNRPECREALLDGMRQLGLTADNTDIFLTHLHSDHTGNAAYLAGEGFSVMMGRTDHRVVTMPQSEKHRETHARFLREGMPKEDLALWSAKSPAIKFAPGAFPARELDDGDVLCYGGYELRCLATPGHTPGHLCLFDEKRKLIFLGDHVLFDISPNICAWNGVPDSLGDYLRSLELMKSLDIETALPAHRARGELTLSERAQQLIEHHRLRLNEAERLVHENPGVTAYELAGLMTWRIRAKNWTDFPPSQKGFAFGETLDFLQVSGCALILTGGMLSVTGASAPARSGSADRGSGASSA